MINAKKGALLAALLLLPIRLHAAAPPEFQIDLKELERPKQPVPSKAPREKASKSRKQSPQKKERAGKTATARKARAAEAAQGEYVRYTVRPGDHIFKILMARFGLSNEQAERLIPSIVELNGISNIKALEVGRTLLIPAAALHEHEPKAAQQHMREKAVEGREEKKAEPQKAPPSAPAAAPGAPEPAVEPPRAPEPVHPTPEAPASNPAPAPVPAQAPYPHEAPALPPNGTPAPVPLPAPDASPSK